MTIYNDRREKDEAFVYDFLFDGIKQGACGYPDKWKGACSGWGSHWNKGDYKIELFIAGGNNEFFSAKKVEFFGFNSFLIA